MKKLISLIVILLIAITARSQVETSEVSNYEKYRLEKEKQEHPTLYKDQAIKPNESLQYKWNADEVNSMTIFQGKNTSVFVEDKNKIKRIVGILNSLKFTEEDFNEGSPVYQISMDVYEDIYIFENNKVMIGDKHFTVDKDINKIFENLYSDLNFKPVAEAKSNNTPNSNNANVFVYYNYSRFFTPYWAHSWYYTWHYDPWYYDWYYDPWYYGYPYSYRYSWYYPYSYRYRYSWYYPYYRPVYYSYSKPRNGRYVGTLGSRRYYANYSTNVRNYNSGRTPKYSAINNYKYTTAINNISRRSTQVSTTTAPLRRNEKTVMNSNVLRRNQRTDVPTVRGQGNADNRRLDVNVFRRNQKTYQEAVRSGERTYTPTYSNPRMSRRPVYNNTNNTNRLYRNQSINRTQNKSNNVVVPQRRSQTRVTTPRTIQRSNTSTRSSGYINRSSSSGSRSTSISRSSSSSSRSSGVSRSSGSRSSGRGRR